MKEVCIRRSLSSHVRFPLPRHRIVLRRRSVCAGREACVPAALQGLAVVDAAASHGVGLTEEDVAPGAQVLRMQFLR